MTRSVSEPSILRVAGACCCPRCGCGPLFDGFLRPHASCASCDLSFQGVDTGDGHAYIVLSVLCFVLVPLILWIVFATSWPLWVHALWISLVVLIGTLAMVRPAKAAMIALQYRHRRQAFMDV